ncbi:MAG: hypothetical protein NC254_07120 [bacterium]|nr:hypothetical protein [bacterium]
MCQAGLTWGGGKSCNIEIDMAKINEKPAKERTVRVEPEMILRWGGAEYASYNKRKSSQHQTGKAIKKAADKRSQRNKRTETTIKSNGGNKYAGKNTSLRGASAGA